MVQEINKETGWDIPIHVDAASGGFIAPFIQPELGTPISYFSTTCRLNCIFQSGTFDYP